MRGTVQVDFGNQTMKKKLTSNVTKEGALAVAGLALFFLLIKFLTR